jgi:hypothetical protein
MMIPTFWLVMTGHAVRWFEHPLPCREQREPSHLQRENAECHAAGQNSVQEATSWTPASRILTNRLNTAFIAKLDWTKLVASIKSRDA